MKKISICMILIMAIMMNSVSLGAVNFSDVFKDHWAYQYIEKIQDLNIINGYPDGTFKPEDKVTTGELMKMAACVYYLPGWKWSDPAEGEHWAMPYLRSLESNAILVENYDSDRLDTPITRGEAVEVMGTVLGWILQRNPDGISNDTTEQYIKTFNDESEIKGRLRRRTLNLCVQRGVINGFEDNTFRQDETLTRAQAAKIIYLISEFKGGSK